MKNQMLKQIGETMSKHSPTILTGVSVAGLITTTVMAVKATPKALQLIEERERLELNRDPNFYKLGKKETIKTVWKCYIPSAIMGGLTVACIIGANSVNLKRNAALAGVYSITERTLKEYQSKVVETLGESKAMQIKDEIAKERIQNDPVSSKEIIITGKGDMLCYDALSGRYFKSDIEKIKRAVNELNRNIISDTFMFVPLNELYYELGLANTQLGELMGWHIDDGIIEPEFSSQIADDGTPCLVLNFNVEPRYIKLD